MPLPILGNSNGSGLLDELEPEEATTGSPGPLDSDGITPRVAGRCVLRRLSSRTCPSRSALRSSISRM